MPFNFQSGGANATAALTDFFDRQRGIKRQALLDQLNQKNVESEISARNEQAKSISEQRQAAMEQNMLNMFKSGHKAGDPIDDSTSPDVMNILKKYSMVDESTPEVQTGGAIQGPDGEWIPDPAGPTTTTGKKRSVYTGDAADRSGLQRQIAIREVINDKNTPAQLKQYLQTVLASGDLEKGLSNPPAGIFDTDDPVMTFDQDTGQLTPAMVNGKPYLKHGGGTLIHTRPPQPPAPGYSFAGVDKDGNPISLNQRSGDFTTRPVTTSTPDKTPTGPIGPKPSASSSSAAKITAADVSLMRTALIGLATAKEKGTDQVSAQAGLWAAQNNIINKLPDPNNELKEVVRGILSDPNKDKMSTPQIILKIQASGKRALTDPELQSLQDVLNLVLGRYNAGQ